MNPVLQPQTMLRAYEAKLEAGNLSPDSSQREVALLLDALQKNLLDAPASRLVRWLFPAPPLRSLYLWGEVGRGKSMLMDMFFATIPLPAAQKRRIHFHAFMQEVHARIHRLRQETEIADQGGDLLLQVAGELAEGLRVLCLDELQVSDVADAMIIHRLFGAILAKGVTFVITSNRPPEELYKGGLQREKFVQFVSLVNTRMDVARIVSPLDYRMRQIKSLETVYLTPDDLMAETRLAGIFARLTHESAVAPTTLEVQGRKLNFAQASGGVLSTDFQSLCETALGPADYLALATHFHTVCLHAVPKLTPEKRNEARRFVTLIDTLYDHRVKLICTAAAAPAALYPAGDGAFEFGRTVSRLAEMQSESYLGQAHIA